MNKGLKAFARWKACTRKKRFATQADAQAEADRQKQDIYPCRYCHGWHLTAGMQKLLATVRRRK